MWVVHWEDVGIMLILSPETSHILSVLPLHNSTGAWLLLPVRAMLLACSWGRISSSLAYEWHSWETDSMTYWPDNTPPYKLHLLVLVYQHVQLGQIVPMYITGWRRWFCKCSHLTTLMRNIWGSFLAIFLKALLRSTAPRDKYLVSVFFFSPSHGLAASQAPLPCFVGPDHNWFTCAGAA